MKPFSESCEQNKDVILEVIKPLLTSCAHLLEIGSGTGQHALYFAKAMPHIQWHTSDRKEALSGIQMWLDDSGSSDSGSSDSGISNVHSPFALDVMQSNWPELQVDAIFMANTLHIMHWDEVQTLFKRAPLLLQDNGIMLVYGPFNYHGQYTSESNRQFDGWLKSRDPKSAIRDFTQVNELANQSGLQFQADYEMPANNRILFWQKKAVAETLS